MKARLLSGAIVLAGLCVTSAATSLGASAAAATFEPVPASSESRTLNFFFTFNIDYSQPKGGPTVTSSSRQVHENVPCPSVRNDC